MKKGAIRAAGREDVIGSVLDGLQGTEDVRAVIGWMIERRELLRADEVRSLYDKIAEFLELVAKARREALVEELECFKDILSLHKTLMDKNHDEPRH
jgi:hypothetical protein